MDRRRFLALGTAFTLIPSTALPDAVTEAVLEVRARVGPWPVASRLIGYNGRIWFANSVKGRDHNSADIWSLDSINGDVRYERHLYSQDAGMPVVHNGLLYWPFEDSRFSLGWGMAEVTNGQSWRPLVIPTAEIFHTHSLAIWGDHLLAVTSAWRAGLQISDNLGRDWTQFHDHPTPKNRLSRFHDPVVLRDALFGYLKDQDGVRLVRFAGDRFEGVPGWPEDREFFGLAVHGNEIFAAVREKDNRLQIWRTDGRSSAPISDQFADMHLQDLASDGTRLWAVSHDREGGQLWSSSNGIEWAPHTRFSGGQPMSLHVIAGKMYVAGAGDDGRGLIWGTPVHPVPRSNGAAAMPAQFPDYGGKTHWRQFGAGLDDALGDISHYENHGRGRLRALVFDAVKRGAPPGFFAQRLNARFPESTVQAFGEKLNVTAADIGRTLVFWGMGLSRQKNVPIAAIKGPWSAPANPFEKYFDPQLAAIWAVAAADQKDAATLDGLIGRLEADHDPLWLRAQVIGTLTALTGKRFAYDTGKWRGWWASARITWSE